MLRSVGVLSGPVELPAPTIWAPTFVHRRRFLEIRGAQIRNAEENGA
jgi:hypothetical protein